MWINTTYVYSFIAWLTVLTPKYADGIIAGMVKKGYSVSSISAPSDIVISKEGNPSAIVSLKITATKEIVTSANIHTDLIAVLNEMKAYYHSVIVAPFVDCCWCGSNIVFNKTISADDQTTKPNKSNLN